MNANLQQNLKAKQKNFESQSVHDEVMGKSIAAAFDSQWFIFLFNPL